MLRVTFILGVAPIFTRVRKGALSTARFDRFKVWNILFSNDFSVGFVLFTDVSVYTNSMNSYYTKSVWQLWGLKFFDLIGRRLSDLGSRGWITSF